MAVAALGYLEITTAKRSEWGPFARDILGMQVDETPEVTRLRLDHRAFRVEIVDGAQEGLSCIGWETPNVQTLERLTEDMRRHGVAVTECDDKEADARAVKGLVRAVDPSGYVIELFYGPRWAATQFVSPTGASFVTDSLGMGHIVLVAPNFDEQLRLYTDVLGFRISDTLPLDPGQIVFMRCNRRHHSLALVDAPAPKGLHHVMVEVADLDAVGLALDRVRDAGTKVTVGLGRHTNDHMTSFYLRSPSRFDIEYGCSGLLVDDAAWSVSELAKTSVWGHRPGGA